MNLTYNMFPCRDELETKLDRLGMLNGMICETAEKYVDIASRYSAMCEKYKRLEENLEDYADRTRRITAKKITLEIPCDGIMHWMDENTFQDHNGRIMSVTQYCLEELSKKKEKLAESDVQEAEELLEAIRMLQAQTSKNTVEPYEN